MGLFDPPGPGEEGRSGAPLADRMRPRDLDEIVGQDRILGPGTALRRAIESDDLRSAILWGPPGCGKTTLARVIARRTRARFVPFSAVVAGIREVRDVMEQAAALRRATGQRTVLFVDEIHRFNKAQQDAFLPYVEQGTIVLIGATTENPSFEVVAPLLSRARVHRMERLSEDDLVLILERAIADRERGLGALGVEMEPELLRLLARRCQGDARAALNALEAAVASTPPGADGRRRIGRDRLEGALGEGSLYHDRAGEAHYDLASAFIKSMRDSDPDATIYWLARMLEAGEDSLFVARRIVRFATEDVGLADPGALELAVAARDAVHFVGRPEGDLALAEAAVYCALAPRSNALETAWTEALETIRQGASDPVPMALRNAPTGLMKAEGYGAGYEYAHDAEDGITRLECLPERLRGRRFYRPAGRGFEATLLERLGRWLEAKTRRRGACPLEAGKPRR